MSKEYSEDILSTSPDIADQEKLDEKLDLQCNSGPLHPIQMFNQLVTPSQLLFLMFLINSIIYVML